MISRTWSRKSIAFCVAVAVLSVYSMVALATPGQKAASGESLPVSGQVTVNGQAAISGATVFSDSVIATGANSSAPFSLGKLGRVELFPQTRALSSVLMTQIFQLRLTQAEFKWRLWRVLRRLLPPKTVPLWLTHNRLLHLTLTFSAAT